MVVADVVARTEVKGLALVLPHVVRQGLENCPSNKGHSHVARIVWLLDPTRLQTTRVSVGVCVWLRLHSLCLCLCASLSVFMCLIVPVCLSLRLSVYLSLSVALWFRSEKHRHCRPVSMSLPLSMCVSVFSVLLSGLVGWLFDVLSLSLLSVCLPYVALSLSVSPCVPLPSSVR